MHDKKHTRCHKIQLWRVYRRHLWVHPRILGSNECLPCWGPHFSPTTLAPCFGFLLPLLVHVPDTDNIIKAFSIFFFFSSYKFPYDFSGIKGMLNLKPFKLIYPESLRAKVYQILIFNDKLNKSQVLLQKNVTPSTYLSHINPSSSFSYSPILTNSKPVYIFFIHNLPFPSI